MKLLFSFIILILSLQSLTNADEVGDFEIEGISIGDSLLDYFEKKKIKKFLNYDHLPSDMKFRISEIYQEDFNMNVYDGIQVFYKPKDKNFIIYSVSGLIDCTKGTKSKCESKFNKISEDLKKVFKNIKPEIRSFPHFDDKSGKSIVKISSFDLVDGRITVSFTDWTKKMKFTDNVAVEVHTREVSNWIDSNYGTD